MTNVWWVAAFVALAACDRGAPAPDSELVDLPARVFARVAEDGATGCSNAEDLRALVEPTGELARCIDAATEVEARRRKSAADWDALDDRCGALVEKHVLAAASHDEGCALYITGRRAGPMISLTLPHSAILMAVHARRRAAGGDALGAMRLLATTLRVTEDAARGRANLMVRVIAATASARAADASSEIVDSLSPADVAPLVPLFDELISRFPRFGDTLRGEHDFTAVHTWLASFMPATWQPPGGRSDMTSSSPSADRTYARAALRRFDQQVALDAMTCSLAASYRDCWIGAVAYGYLHPFDPRMYIEQQARVLSHVVALRIGLEVRREARCPDAGALESPRYTALRRPAALGDRVLVVREGTGLTVRPPVWARAEKAVWRVACP